MPCVGRARELRELLDIVTTGPGAALVRGPVGVGKTRLLEAVAEELGRSGWSLERCAGISAGRTTPFGPLLHLLDIDDLPSQTPGERLLLLGRKLRDRAAGGQLLLIIDDAHLLDRESVLLIHHLVTREPIAVLLAARTPDPVHMDIVNFVKDGLVSELNVAPLERGPSDELVCELLHGDRVQPLVFEGVWRVAEGNPLFIRELIIASIDTGALAYGRDRVWSLEGSLGTSHLLDEVIAQRLDRLDEESQGLLDALAVAGPMRLALVERLSSLQALDALEDAGIVAMVRNGSDDVIRPSHPLYTEIPRQHASRARLQRARRRVARELGTSYTPEDLLLRARLHLEAGDSHSVTFLKAALLAEQRFDGQFALVCADGALAAGFAGEAARIRARALGMIGRLSDAQAEFAALGQCTQEPDELAAIALDHAHLLVFHAGDAQQAEALLRRTMEVVPEDAALPLRSHLAMLLFFSGRATEAIAVAGPLLADPAVPATIAGEVSAPLLMVGRPSEALALTERAFQEVRSREVEEFQVVRMLISVFDRLLALWQLGRATEGDDPLEPFQGTTLQHFATHELLGRAFESTQAFIRGHLAEAVEGHLRLIREFGTSSLPIVTFNATLLATVFALQGDFPSAREQLQFVDSTPEPTLGGYRWWIERARALAVAAEGDTADAVERSTDLADRFLDQCFAVTTSLHDVVRMGHAPIVVDRLRAQASREHASWWDAMCSAHADSAARMDADALMEVSLRFEAGGLDLHACESAAQAARAYSSSGRRVGEARAHDRVTVLWERCGRPRTSALDRIAPVLTSREHQVALLAARGLSNAEIADCLGTSTRTIGNQLQAVYSKLGIHSRDELRELSDS